VSTIETQALDFCETALFDDPWETYRWLRNNAPIYRDEKNDLYVISKHEDVFHMSRDSETYCSKFGVRPVIAGDMSIITLDGEEHVRTRRLINQGFTPRQVRNLIPHVRELSNQLIDEIADKGEIDFVEDFAIHVPLIIISELMGLDAEARMKMYRWSDDMMAGDGHIDGDDPKLLAAATAFGEYAEMLLGLIAERRANPSKDDIIGILTQAFDAGELEKEHKALQGISEERMAEILAERSELDDDELFAFLAVLLVAGNETTRNALSGGLLALSLFPDERQRLVERLNDDAFVDLAVDELIRYVTPVLAFIRTVTKDHTYKGVDFKEGDRVLLLYQSANRDEDVFDRPDELILDRNPNPHLAFGIGPHFCLGANLARMEVKTVFQELFHRLPDIRIADNATLHRGESSLVLALQHLPGIFDASNGCPAHGITPEAGAHASGCPVAH
jgi:cytochrome P450 family 142 subfamily A polypeptide 1